MKIELSDNAIIIFSATKNVGRKIRSFFSLERGVINYTNAFYEPGVDIKGEDFCCDEDYCSRKNVYIFRIYEGSLLEKVLRIGLYLILLDNTKESHLLRINEEIFER